MSIYVDPEEYYGSHEPEKEACKDGDINELGKLNLDSLEVLDWQHLYQEVDETDKDDLPIGGYKYRGSIYSLGEYLEE